MSPHSVTNVATGIKHCCKSSHGHQHTDFCRCHVISDNFWLTSLFRLCSMRERHPSQSDRHYSQHPPDIVRYFKSTRLQIEGLSVCYEENQGDAILVIEGSSRAIAAARDDVDRQAKLLCRRQYGMSGHTMEAF